MARLASKLPSRWQLPPSENPSVARIHLKSRKGISAAMGMKRMVVSRYAPILVIALSLAGSATAQTNLAAKLANIHINNFGQINDNYYRGAQPERVGMKFYRIPMTTTDRPSSAKITQFLKLVNDPANQPVFVHCQGGRHRTGVMTAVYRMTRDGWNSEQAYQEMKQYNFEGFPGHPVLKSFVYDYYTQIEDSSVADKSAFESKSNPKIPLETATK
jgi:protein-tyrosine phosphatase